MLSDLEKLFEKFPFYIYSELKYNLSTDQLIEIVLDLGRKPEARFFTESKYLSQKIVSWQDLDYITKRICKFNSENRAGIERTLHRISCIRNRQFLITGLTCRIGRSVFGTISVIRDLLESEQSILILGKPGIGKTTIIREISRILSDEIEKRVVIIDTSNEIAGESDIPHYAIGRARRLHVTKSQFQHQVMIEAVENHMPEVIIIDEIGTELEVLAARTITEKGVQLIGTTHGNCLQNLIKNPSLVDLIGGIQYVILSDYEAKRRRTQKTILERKAYPAFEILVEVNQQNSWTIHEDIKSSIDTLLKGENFIEQVRIFTLPEKIKILSEQINFRKNFLSITTWNSFNQLKKKNLLTLNSKRLIIYSYSISNNLLKEILFKMGINFILTNDLKKASIILGLKKHLIKNNSLILIANKHNTPIYTFKTINYYQLVKLFSIIRLSL